MVELADDLARRVVVLGDFDFPDDTLAVVGVHLVEGHERELVKVEHLTNVRPVLEALDPASLDQICKADDHRRILLEDHVPKVHNGVAFRPLCRYVQVLAGEALLMYDARYRAKHYGHGHMVSRGWYLR